MQPPSQQISTCPTCGAALEETRGGCMFCLLQAGMGSEEETVHDSTPDALEGGMRFGIYEVDLHADGSLCELGRGAMGVTYRATDTSLQRKVALKIIKSAIAERSADARERFIREARSAAALRHEHIATVYQFGMRFETGQYYYAMELIEGETLEDRVHRAGPLDARTTIAIAEQVTSALAAAEKHGLVHRDLKPANLMLVNADDPEVMGRDQTPSRPSRMRALRKSGIPVVKIIDFGLAKAFHSATDPKSLTHDRFVGTPAFASPEQFEHSALDVRSDIYSLGETLWFALTGKTPFVGRTLSEIHRAQKSNALPIDQLKAAHVPHGLRSLLGSMLAFEPASRPGTRELAVRLKSCSPETRSVRRSRLGLAAVFTLILGAAGFFAFRSLHTQNSGLNPPIAEKSIAVLPFENQSDEKENVYFANGVQDEILNDLAKVADLKVISRTSVMQYRIGVTRNLRQIAKELGVAYVVEGSVQRVATRVRVSAQLIDAKTDMHLWGERYDRDLADVFAIQSEIAKAIADHLQAQISPNEKIAMSETPTTNLMANKLYLQAIDLEMSASPDATGKRKLLEAAALLEDAVKQDPQFFLAYCLLSRVNLDLYFYGLDHTTMRRDMANVALQKANQINADSGEVHLATAAFAYYGFRDYDRARAELELARKTLPNNADVFQLTGLIDRRQGRWADAMRNLDRAVELDPRNSAILENAGGTYQGLRRYSDASSLFRRALEILPREYRIRTEVAQIPLMSRADIQPLHAELASILNEEPIATQKIAAPLFLCALMERDTEAADRAIANMPSDGMTGYGNVLLPKEWYVALAARTFGGERKSEAEFTAVKTIEERRVRDQKEYAGAWSILALAEAALGHKNDAVQHARHACELLPVTKDAVDGPAFVVNLAIVYDWIGDKDAALRELQTAAQVPFGVTYGDLKLHPRWDSLRDQTGFKKIEASLAPK
jgi:serine/threonine protein kinase/Flp pilus assembly protein TadD